MIECFDTFSPENPFQKLQGRTSTRISCEENRKKINLKTNQRLTFSDLKLTLGN
jgi:hypothetical protein